ncbi:VCBS repeat-containing protein [Algoriphagus boritolerans]|uniref:FG-GAP repeat domain-containing protein n=1 Tax=Algoriphagus boritolerans TaxID=308111 RepID=UPI002FCE5B2B
MYLYLWRPCEQSTLDQRWHGKLCRAIGHTGTSTEGPGNGDRRQVVDWDGNGKMDLVVVGEWMAPTFFKNTGGKLEKTEMPNLANLKGWYRTIEIGDFNGDGLPDMALGNHGLNTRFKASASSPVSLFLNDFDQNGSIEHIFTQNVDGVQIPYTLKHELERQVPGIKKKYIRYSDYNNKGLNDIFPKEITDQSIIQEVNSFESGVLMNLGGGNFEWKPFPRFAQRSWTFAIQVLDINEDGIPDLILGGNLAQVKPEIGKFDASYGDVLIGKGDGTFTFSPNYQNGLKLEGDVREFALLGEKQILVVKNSAAAEIWKY